MARDKRFSVWFVELVVFLQVSKSWEILVYLFSFLWAIWIARNHKVFRQAVISPDLVLFFMQDWISRSMAAFDFKTSIRLSSPRSTTSPSPVPLSLCLNGSVGLDYDITLIFDGAFKSQDQTAGAGWIFRYTTSDLIIGRGSRAFFSSSAVHSELQACLWALRIAERRGFCRILIYTDCSSLVSFLQGKSSVDISCLWLLQDVKDVISRLSACELRKVPRQWVAPAHWLATKARQRLFLLWSF